MKRGLRQGDPLLPLLFLIVAEALQVMITDACNKGLKINISKCRLFGIGVPLRDVENITRAFNCLHGSLPFTYFGLPVGRSMRKTMDWTEVINRFFKRIASWKVNLLSIGGRLTLMKSVLGSLPFYFLSLFKAPKAIINKLKSMRRQFFWGMKEGVKKICWALWRKVIVEIHGSNGGFDLMDGSGKRSTCSYIVSSCNRIEQLGVPLNNLMVRKIYRRTKTYFWMDNWLKDSRLLKDCFPRLFALEQHTDYLVSHRWVLEDSVWQGKWNWTRQPSGRTDGDLAKPMTDLNGLTLDEAQDDKWVWTLTSSRKFSIASLCRAIHLRVNTNDVSAPLFTWNSWVPRKVNVCAWRFALNRLPTRLNLCKRGINPPTSSWWKVLSRFSLSDVLKGKFDFIKDKWTLKLFHVVCLFLICSSKCRIGWYHWIRAPQEVAIL
ncbi:RNA-directed DNA polymerase, eukaryota, reverse transcriptase zinc-binding domain protein [Tanacetum coccineum]